MGQASISQLEIGLNAKQAFKRAKEKAIEEYGKNPYAGTINCAHGMKEVSIPEATSNEPLQKENGSYDWVLEYLQESGIEDRILERYDKFGGIACINLGIHEWRVIDAKEVQINVPDKGANRFACYASDDFNSPIDYSPLLDSIMKGKAIDDVKQRGTTVEIWQVDNKNNKVKKLIEYTPLVKRVPDKRDGARALYVYWFCGWVSC